MVKLGRNAKIGIIIIIVVIIIIGIIGGYYLLLLSVTPELHYQYETANGQSHPDFVNDALQDGPVFIEFTQNDENCPACKRMRPKVEQLKSEFKDEVTFCIININENSIITTFRGSEKMDTISDSQERDYYAVYDIESIAGGLVATPTYVIITKIKDDTDSVKPHFAVGYGEFMSEDAEKTKLALANDLNYAKIRYDLNN
jgi:thiol-disulfide isomerase/thioredoxin